MKTLYININNEQIQSNEELEVLNYDLDSDFFFYLGEKIAKGCKVENENALITDFNTQDAAEDYQQIIAQWNEIKAILFSEECDDDYEFKLPAGYIHWLKYHPQYVSVYDKNFSHGESGIIYIDLEELYEESVESMQRRILRKLQRDDLHKEIDEIVFNDDAVTRKASIVSTIKEKYEGVGFRAYKKNEEKPHTSPQVCEKCGKNPCECNLEKQYYYAVATISSVCYMGETKYKFYNHNGQPLDDNEYYIVAEGVADKVFRKVATYKFGDGDGKTNLLVIKTEGDPTLYYISSNGKFYKIGEYDYENGQRVDNTNQKEYWKYQAYIIQNKYILYKSGLNCTLYEINGNSSPRLLSKFQSKINFVEGGYICRDFLTNGEYTINWKTGELINIANNRFCIILGYNNDSPVYLIPPKKWNFEENGYRNSSVVDAEGNFMWKFNADAFEILSNDLLFLDGGNGKPKVINLEGKTIFKLNNKYDDVDEVTICGYDCLKFNEKIYIISKDKCVDYLSESVYVIVKGYTAHVYNIHTDEFLSILNMPEYIYSADGSCCSDSLYGWMPDDLYAIPFEEWGDQGDIYSISHCKKIYTTIGNERFCESNKDKFAIEGESYFEIYDNIGKLLLTFEKDDDYTPKPELHDNGYISWFNKKQGRVEYYDALLNPYYINIDDRLNINFESIAITVLSERCVIIRSEEKDFVFVDNEYVCKCHKLKQYDENNYYGYSCDEDGLYCAVNAKNGITKIPDTIIAGRYSELYMVK